MNQITITSIQYFKMSWKTYHICHNIRIFQWRANLHKHFYLINSILHSIQLYKSYCLKKNKTKQVLNTIAIENKNLYYF